MLYIINDNNNFLETNYFTDAEEVKCFLKDFLCDEYGIYDETHNVIFDLFDFIEDSKLKEVCEKYNFTLNEVVIKNKFCFVTELQEREIYYNDQLIAEFTKNNTADEIEKIIKKANESWMSCKDAYEIADYINNNYEIKQAAEE